MTLYRVGYVESRIGYSLSDLKITKTPLVLVGTIEEVTVTATFDEALKK